MCLRSLKKIMEDSGGAVNAFLGVVLHPSDLDWLAEVGTELDMIGGDNVWVFTDGITSNDVRDTEFPDALKGSLRCVAMDGSLTAEGLSQYDKYEADFHLLDEDVEFMKYLKKTAYNFTSDGVVDGIPEGVDVSDFHAVDPLFFKNAKKSTYEAYFFDSVMQVGQAERLSNERPLKTRCGRAQSERATGERAVCAEQRVAPLSSLARPPLRPYPTPNTPIKHAAPLFTLVYGTPPYMFWARSVCVCEPLPLVHTNVYMFWAIGVCHRCVPSVYAIGVCHRCMPSVFVRGAC